MATPMEVLKFNLQEKQYPYFDNTELELLLESNDNNILKSSWKGCVLKAIADDEADIGPIKTSSNREYWLGLAEQYKSDYEKSLKENTTYTGYKTSMKRVDGQ